MICREFLEANISKVGSVFEASESTPEFLKVWRPLKIDQDSIIIFFKKIRGGVRLFSEDSRGLWACG